MKTQLTIQQALSEGFTHYSTEGAEYCYKIKDIDVAYFPDKPVYVVDKENGYSFSITAESIRELVIERLIDEQDEVSDPNGELSTLAADADFEKLAADINERMSSKKFFDITEIELVP